MALRRGGLDGAAAEGARDRWEAHREGSWRGAVRAVSFRTFVQPYKESSYACQSRNSRRWLLASYHCLDLSCCTVTTTTLPRTPTSPRPRAVAPLRPLGRGAALEYYLRKYSHEFESQLHAALVHAYLGPRCVPKEQKRAPCSHVFRTVACGNVVIC